MAKAQVRVDGTKIALRRERNKLLAYLSDRFVVLARTGIKAGVTVYGLYKGHELIMTLATGGLVNWNIVIADLLNGRAAELAGLLVGGLGVAYGAHERSLRRAVIEKSGPYKAELERLIDSKRSGSNLLASGTNSGEDEEP